MRRKLIPAPFAIVLLATVLSVPVFPAEFPSRVDRVVLYPDMAEGPRVVEGGAPPPRREKELLERGVLAIYAPGEATKDGEKGRPPRLSVAEVDAALSLYRARVAALDGSGFASDRKARDLEKKIAAARQKLDKIRNPRPTQEKVVRIDLAPPGKCRLAVTYRVPAAGFVPRYNARLVPGTGILSLELVADAWQRTGEDWKEATLAFSTARPGKTAQLPPLPPWELDFYQPPVARPMMKMRSEAADAALAGAFAPEAKEEASLPPPARRFASP